MTFPPTGSSLDEQVPNSARGEEGGAAMLIHARFVSTDHSPRRSSNARTC